MCESPMNLAYRIDAIARDFELKWGTQDTVSIEDCLSGNCEIPREMLLRELLLIEFELYLSAGGELSVSDYVRRFPEDESLVVKAAEQVHMPESLGTRRSQRTTDPMTGDATLPPRTKSESAETPTQVHGQPPTVRPGKRVIDVYEIVKPIGEGGMGIVYRAFDRSLQREVALKVVKSGVFASRDELERFSIEARAAGQLEHPNIVGVHSYGIHEGFPFIAMPFIEGESLAALKNPLDATQAARLLVTLAEAIEHAHTQGIIHRDLKPGNILMAADGRPWITDFGLARNLQSDVQITRSGAVLGSPQYMSPEQAAGRSDETGVRTDVYSLGAVLYFVLTMSPPFIGASPTEVMERVRRQDARSPRELVDSIPKDIETICLKCLAKEPDSRYQSAQELADDLNRFLEKLPIVARPIPVHERVIRWCRRNPLPATIVSLVFLLAATATVSAGIIEQRRRDAVKARNAQLTAKLDSDDANVYAREQQLRTWGFLQKLVAERRIGADRVLRQNFLAPDELASVDTELLAANVEQRVKVDHKFCNGDWGLMDCMVSPDRRLIVTADQSGRVQVVDSNSGSVKQTVKSGLWSEQKKRWLHFVERTPAQESEPLFTSVDWMDQRTIIGATKDGLVSTLPTSATTKPTVLHESEEQLNFVRYDQTSRRILTCSDSGTLTLLNASGEPIAVESEVQVPVTAVACLSTHDIWVVGHADGALRVFDGRLTLIHTREFGEPITAITPNTSAEHSDFVVCAGKLPVQSMRFTAESKDIELLRGFDVVDRDPGRIFECAAVDGDQLVAFDNQGRWSRWDFSSGELINDIPVGAGRDPRLPETTPLLQQRATSRVISIDESRFLLFDQSGVGFILRHVEDVKAADWKRLPFTIHEQSQLTPVAETRSLFWALSRGGQLTVLDAVAEKLLDTTMAHDGGYAEIVGLADGTAITVGGDRFIKRWRYDDQKIVEVHRIEHRSNLLSLAVSEATHLLAAVDVDSRLTTWNLIGHLKVNERPIDEMAPGIPLTGSVAFNCDGTLIAAFGSQQSFVVCRAGTLDNVTKFGKRTAGKGGTCLAWSPEVPWRLVTADNTGRGAVFVEHADDRFPNRRLTERLSGSPVTVDYAITNDKRRIVSLERAGKLHFYTARHFVEVSEAEVPAEDCCSLAVGDTLKCLIVATVAGELYLRTVGEIIPAPVPTHQPTQATRHALTSTADNIAVDCVDSATLSPAGSGVVPLVIKESPDYRAGDLHIVRFRNGVWRLDLVEANGSVGQHGRGIAFDDDNHVIVAFRKMVGDPEGYAGELTLAQEQPDGTWNTETVPPVSNAGHYPLLLLNQDRQVSSILHFDYAGMRMLRSRRRTDEPTQWDLSIVRYGLGQGTKGVQMPDETIVCVSRTNRFGGDQAPYKIVEISPDGTTEFADCLADEVLRTLQDSIVVRSRAELLRYRNRKSETWATMPHGYQPAAMSVRLSLDALGRPVVGELHRESGRIFISLLVEDRWHTTELARVQTKPGERILASWIEASNRAAILTISQSYPCELSVIDGLLSEDFTAQ